MTIFWQNIQEQVIGLTQWAEIGDVILAIKLGKHAGVTGQN